jgi:hypothetical protein
MPCAPPGPPFLRGGKLNAAQLGIRLSLSMKDRSMILRFRTVMGALLGAVIATPGAGAENITRGG